MLFSPLIQREVGRLLDEREPFVLCTVVDAKGSVPGKVGARMIVYADGRIAGTVGGAGLEEKVKAAAKEALVTGKPRTQSFDLMRRKPGGLDSVCGGTVEVYVEPVLPQPHLLLCGGGHVCNAVARLADQLEYSYSVLDDRPEYASPERYPSARSIYPMKPAEFFSKVDPKRFSHLLLLGYSYQVDEEILQLGLPRFSGWIGLIGSQTKRHEMFDDLKKGGLAESDLARVECPVGLAIGAESPSEIAVSILGRIIQTVKTPSPP